MTELPEEMIEPTKLESEHDRDMKLESLLNDNQAIKSRIDEVEAESKRISNNLKLYLIVNVLKNDESAGLNVEPGSNEDTLSLTSPNTDVCIVEYDFKN